MTRISDFSPIADRYDATRQIPGPLLDRCFRRLADEGVLPRRARVLDIGCGTGQIAGPLARLGHGVLGLDVSLAMVRVAARKVEPGWDARFAVGDARAIPASAEVFDAVVYSKLLMHVEDWRAACREFLRVTRPGGAVIQVSDKRAFDSAVRRAFARRADALGYTDRFLGPLPSSGAVPAHMAQLGCATAKVEPDDLRWERRVTAREILDGFRERLFAEYWSLPADVYAAILADVSAWAARQPGGLDAEEALRPFLSIEVYRLPA